MFDPRKIWLAFIFVGVFLQPAANAQEIEVSKLPWCGDIDEFSASFISDSIYYCSRQRTHAFKLVEDAEGMYQTNLFGTKVDVSLIESIGIRRSRWNDQFWPGNGRSSFKGTIYYFI
jgi:hypothetical protein